jgi:hypothetical protein
MLKNKVLKRRKITALPRNRCLTMILVGMVLNLMSASGITWVNGSSALYLTAQPAPIITTPITFSLNSQVKRYLNIEANATTTEAEANQAGNNANHCGRMNSKAEVQEIRFGFHPRFNIESPIDMFMTLRGNGETQALRYDDERSLITAAYKGTLTRADMRRLTARVQEAFREYRNAAPRDENIVTEGNLFYLSIKLKNGAIEQLGGKVPDMPELMGKLIGDLSVLWKRLKKTAPAPGYLRSFVIGKKRLELLKSNGSLRFVTLNEYPSDTHPIVIDAINNSPSFQAINRAQLDKLRAQKTMVLSYNGSVYEVFLFSSRK